MDSVPNQAKVIVSILQLVTKLLLHILHALGFPVYGIMYEVTSDYWKKITLGPIAFTFLYYYNRRSTKEVNMDS